MGLPEGISPSSVPSKERLDSLTEDDLFAIIDHLGSGGMFVGGQFWIDELTRRRTTKVLERLIEWTALTSAALEQETQISSRIADLTAQAAEENAKTAGLNHEMRDLTRRMYWLTAANIVISVGALMVSVVALLST